MQKKIYTYVRDALNDVPLPPAGTARAEPNLLRLANALRPKGRAICGTVKDVIDKVVAPLLHESEDDTVV